MVFTKKEAREITNITNKIKENEVVGFNCSYNGELLFAVALNPLDYREKTDFASFPKTKTDEGQSYNIYSLINEEINLLATIDSNFNFHDLQCLNKHELLLVCARSKYRSENDYEKNGKIYSTEGKFLKEILLGDGIQDVQADSNGVIWTSYFDEGIFGNYGWNNPVGQNGLIAWNHDGEKLYEYQPLHPLQEMCDCYALNVVSSQEVWCYYYTDFPLVKIKNYQVEDYWHIPIKGSSVFAVYKNFALFNSSYNEDPTLLHLVKLQDHSKAKEVRQIKINNLKKIDRIIGRQDALYFLSDKKVFLVYVQEVL